jgi:hypothetical protein
MRRSQPYQPSLLRFLHGINTLVAVLAIITSFWVYKTFDGRFGRLPLPEINDIIGIHGTLGLTFLLMMPVFALYSFHVGHQRLVQSDSFAKLAQVGKPIWWYSLHRIVNTLMLLAATWALITGRMMKEEWLPTREFYHIWYQLHLSGWAILVVCLAIHLLMGIKVGGLPLIVSMFSFKNRPNDSPTTWLQQIRSLFNRSQL